jgi:hypothetical protein
MIIMREYSRKRVYYSIFQGEFDYQLYSSIGVYYSLLQGESDYQLCFSIGVMVLRQSAKKYQNCVDGDAC